VKSASGREQRLSERLWTLTQELDQRQRELEDAAAVVREARVQVGHAKRSTRWRFGERAGKLAAAATFGRADPDRYALNDAAATLAELEARLTGLRRSMGSRPPGGAGSKQRLRVTVVAWDMAHNGVIRAYYLAAMLQRHYDVTLVGANFPHHGTRIWEPIRSSDLPMRSFPGDRLPAFVERAERALCGIQTDLVIACKARFPSLLVAMLLKHVHGVPVIVDVDERELSFHPAAQGISLDELERSREDPDFTSPYGQLWTRACEGLVCDADAITVASPAVQALYGGTIVPHARDELAFDPARFDRDAVRAELGYTPEDRVVLFAGTPRPHKGIIEIARALEELDDRYKLLVVGSFSDPDERTELARVAADRTQLVDFRPVSEIPRLTALADLMCLPQDAQSDVAQHQTPAKLTEALAMGVPVLARETPPLASFVEEGVISAIGDAPLATRVAELFADRDGMRRAAERGREVFLERLSYGAAIEALDEVIVGLEGERREPPASWGRAYKLARSAAAAGPKRQVTRRVPPASPVWDVVFFWRLSYSGFYGRRADMLAKYLAQSERTRRLVHFDRPTDWTWIESRREAARRGVNHWELIARRGRRLALLGERRGKLHSYTMVAQPTKDASAWQRALLPTADEYLGFVAQVLERNRIGKRPVLFWVWPPDFRFVDLHQAFAPALTIADVVDDERSWMTPGSPRYERVTHNHQQILSLCDLVMTHNEPLAERLQWFGVEPAVVPNATELFDTRRRRRPRELRHLKGPIIGYSGTLSFRLDLELLERIARERRDCQLLFIGSAHGPEDVLALAKHPNVHFIGVRTYPDVTRYIRCFDVAIIPHLDDEMSRAMNPLKAYLYASCGVPAVSTRIANLDLATLDGAIRITHSHDEFLAAIDETLEQRRRGELRLPSREQIAPHTWEHRVREIERLIDSVTR
jgi:glycosyltransferase involved in cell wall biosynthesis